VQSVTFNIENVMEHLIDGDPTSCVLLNEAAMAMDFDVKNKIGGGSLLVLMIEAPIPFILIPGLLYTYIIQFSTCYYC
jgi:hypothetical protein